jgi:hypothetical protein
MPTSLKTRSFATPQQSDLWGDRSDCHPGQAKRERGSQKGRRFDAFTVPDNAPPFLDLMTLIFPPIPSSWPPLEAAIQKNTSISGDWMAGLSPAMTVERKFADVFMAS